ncbi:hypothetical protein GUJ93_ZPchr0005g15877 [Zizania palustris]|uniref:SCP domain-containing protein n=1 Tax=Zizania palustris TaxID=103762 RepID=A0A8J5VG86_ZIZPA|nr:hypothetical protein GUJ93_ZPchr0005g15877 [Zizania palustris]
MASLFALLLAFSVLLPSASPTSFDPDHQIAPDHQIPKLVNSSSPSPEPAPSSSNAPAPKPGGLVSPTNGTGSYKGMRREFVNGHNKVRARYGVPPLTWNNKLARQARRWSNAMRNDCELKHSGSKFGESLFVDGNGWNATASDAVTMWTDEEPLYDKQTGRCNGGHNFGDCGHFALMVKKKYRTMGCARSECYKGGVFIVCNYYLQNP